MDRRLFVIAKANTVTQVAIRETGGKTRVACVRFSGVVFTLVGPIWQCTRDPTGDRTRDLAHRRHTFRPLGHGGWGGGLRTLQMISIHASEKNENNYLPNAIKISQQFISTVVIAIALFANVYL